MKNVVDLNWINLIYVIFWGVISFISSFTGILDLDCRQVVSQNLLKDVLNPVFIWIIAFFGDYLYSVFSLKKDTQILDERWTKVSYILVESLFVILLLSINVEGNPWRIFCVVMLYLCMMGLKTSSLYAVCPRQKVASV